MSTSDSGKPRNKLVVQIEGGHPGYKNYLFIAAEPGLRELSGALLRLADLSAGARIDVHVSERSDPASLGSLAFAKCTEEKLLELQQPTAQVHARRLAKSLLFFAAIVIVGVGAWHCARYVLGFLIWVVRTLAA